MQNFYMRGRDCFNRPVCGVPGAEIELVERTSDDFNWTFRRTGRTRRLLNLASYNYLGFAESGGATAQHVAHSIRRDGVATCSARVDVGSLGCHVELERQVARFLGKDEAIVFGMGWFL